MALRVAPDQWGVPLVLAGAAAMIGMLAGVDPALALGGSLALAFLLLALADLSLALAVFTSLTFFELVPALGGSSLSLTKIAGGVLALGWVAALLSRPESDRDFLRANPLAGALLLGFLAWVGLSFFWANDQNAVLEGWYRFALNAVLILIVFTAVQTRDQAIRVCAAFALGAAAVALYGIFSGSGLTGPAGQSERISGLGEDPNELAATLVAAIVVAGGLTFILKRRPGLKLLLVGGIVVSLAGIFLTVSREGLVALFVAAATAVVLSGRFRGRATTAAVALSLAAIGYFAFAAPEADRVRVTDFSDGGTGRVDIWNIGLRMFEANPVLGVGSQNFPSESVNYLLTEPGVLLRDDFIIDTPKVAHNVYLGTAAELGVPGLLLYTGLIVAILAIGLRAAREFGAQGDTQMELLTRAILVAVIAILAALFFASDEFKKQLWLLMGLLPAMLALARRQAREGGSPEAARRR